MRNEIRQFEHFPKEDVCVVCGDNRDAPCVLVVIDGTEEGNIAQAKPVHVSCAVATNFNKDLGVLYRAIRRG